MFSPNSSDLRAYHSAVSQLRGFFCARGFVEVYTQGRRSILAACEDPTTVATYEYEGKLWPLPQTGQMWLEYDLLNNPSVRGLFCLTTSYRAEKNPIAGRHATIFPMFEFETRGDMNDLRILEEQLLAHLGFLDPVSVWYKDAAKKFGVTEIDAETEERMWDEYGPAILLEHFPTHTSPFWNMKVTNGLAHKIDVLLFGMETIGSAERDCDRLAMRDRFHTISDGQYAGKLFELFGKDRVLAELDDFLKLPFFPRFGGGIGLMPRLTRALALAEEGWTKLVA